MRFRLLFALLALVLQVPVIFADDEVPTAALTFVVDDADRVEISVAGDVLTDIKTGSNTVDIMQWSNVTIAPKADCTIKSVVNSENKELEIKDGSVTFMVLEAVPETYTITSEKSSEVKFTIDVDDPSKVKVVDKSYAAVALEAGVNNLEMSALSFPLVIGPAEYGNELYQVTLDEVALEATYGSYSVTPVENCAIKIVANFPDIDCTVSFAYPEGISNFFTAVAVNNEEATIADNAIDVKCGDKVTLYYNSSCWDTEDAPIAVKINDVALQGFWPGYSFVVKENTKVEITQATAVEMITVCVEVDNPANVVVYRADKAYRDIINIAAGPNTVELPKDDASLVITNVEEDDEESKITSVTVNGTPKQVAFYNEIEIKDLEANDTVKVFTEGNFGPVAPTEPEIEAEPAADSTVKSLSSVTLYLNAEWFFDDDEDLFEVVNEDSIYFTLNGERYCDAIANLDVETIQFVPAGLIYRAGNYALVIEKGALAWVREEGGEFVANDEAMTYAYTVEGVATDIAELPFTIDPAPGSTVETFEWTMAITEDYDELDVSEMMVFIYKDGKELCGVFAEPSEDYASVVITPEEEITEEGEYELIFTAGAVYCDGDESYYNSDPLVFAYTLKKAVDSVISIEAPAAMPQGVFNLQGIKVADTLDRLPAGIYIFNGKTVRIK